MRAFAACVVVLAGCAQISGLDVLDIADATSDVVVIGDSGADVLQSNDAGNTKDANIIDAPPVLDSGKDAFGKDASLGPCTKPADCNGTSSVCCETLTTSGQNFSSCTVDADTVACATPNACATSVNFTCGKDVLRRCTATSDCTEASYPKCCTIPVDDASTRQVCLTSGLASVLNGTCL